MIAATVRKTVSPGELPEFGALMPNRPKRPAERRCAALVVALLLLAGCGGGEHSTYPAGGKVTFSDGAPLTSGRVELQLIDAKKHVSARGWIQPDGTFTLSTYETGDGAVEGEHLALVTPGRTERIAPHFRSYQTSGLKFTVTRDKGKNRFDIVVTRN